MPGGVPCVGESVSLPLTPPPRLVDKSNSLMESDELKRRAELWPSRITRVGEDFIRKEKKIG